MDSAEDDISETQPYLQPGRTAENTNTREFY